MGAFVRMESGQRTRSGSGKIMQDANRYTVRMDDPLTPADAERLLNVLTRLADTPLDAAQRRARTKRKGPVSPDSETGCGPFYRRRPITARDVLQRAFPTWEASSG